LRDVKIKWDKKPLWESELPKIIYCGETLRVFAQFQSPPEKPPVLSYVIATEKKELTPKTFAQTDNPIITKLGGAKKYDDTQSHESKLELSLRYQLLTPQTALLLIFENAVKAEGTPTLQKVPQMLAAGWGGTSSVDDYDDYYQAELCCKKSYNSSSLPPPPAELCFCSFDITESEASTSDDFCIDKPSLESCSAREEKNLSPRIDILDNIFQFICDFDWREDNEKIARKLWKDQNWLNNIPSEIVEAKQITANTKYQQHLLNLLGVEYEGVGKIIAVNVIIGENWRRDYVLFGYDKTKNMLTIIVPLEFSYQALLSNVLKSYILSKVVDKKKLLQDFNLPADTQFAAAVLAEQSDKINNEMQHRYIGRLIKKLGVCVELVQGSALAQLNIEMFITNSLY
jgi:hypothetical protein